MKRIKNKYVSLERRIARLECSLITFTLSPKIYALMVEAEQVKEGVW